MYVHSLFDVCDRYMEMRERESDNKEVWCPQVLVSKNKASRRTYGSHPCMMKKITFLRNFYLLFLERIVHAIIIAMRPKKQSVGRFASCNK